MVPATLEPRAPHSDVVEVPLANKIFVCAKLAPRFGWTDVGQHLQSRCKLPAGGYLPLAQGRLPLHKGQEGPHSINDTEGRATHSIGRATTPSPTAKRSGNRPPSATWPWLLGLTEELAAKPPTHAPRRTWHFAEASFYPRQGFLHRETHLTRLASQWLNREVLLTKLGGGRMATGRHTPGTLRLGSCTKQPLRLPSVLG